MELCTNYWETIIDECNNSVVLEEEGKDDKTLTASGGKTMLWHQILGHIWKTKSSKIFI